MYCSSHVSSDQPDVNDSLIDTVIRQQLGPYRRPLAERALKQAQHIRKILVARAERSWILDACCGRGDSSHALALANPSRLVVGVDRSQDRLKRFPRVGASNLVLIRENLEDFYLAMKSLGMPPEDVFFYYPNPSPLSKNLKRRWHAHPVFPLMAQNSRRMVMRTNWEVLAHEFARSIKFLGARVGLREILGDSPGLTLFEQKYRESGHALYEVRADCEGA